MFRRNQLSISTCFALALTSCGTVRALAQLTPQQQIEQQLSIQAQQQLQTREAADHQRQIEEQREIQLRGDRQLRAQARTEQQRDAQEKADEELRLQSQAEQQRQIQLQQAEQQSEQPPRRPDYTAQRQTLESVAQPFQPDRTAHVPFSPLIARSVGFGLLAGACAVVLGKLLQRRFKT
jgi:hypothetical protein